MTTKLYDENAYLSQFKTMVIACEKTDCDKYEIELSSTAFFPTSGGQSGDTGTIDGCNVLETKYKDKEETIIVHVTDTFVEPGKEVNCKIDFEKRYRKMQKIVF